MAGKRKRGDTAGEGQEAGVNGDSSARQLERFRDWLGDALTILRT